MVGRGGRITDKIFKPSFRVIDMGGNIADLGAWSDARDWNNYFYDDETKEVGAPIPSAVRECHACDFLCPANSLKCPDCGVERLYTGGVTGLPTLYGELVIPSPTRILYYCYSNNYDCLTARKIVYNYVADMFINVSFDTFNKNRADGTLFERTRKFIMPYYFAIQNSTLEGNKVRTLESFTNETIKEIERRYSTK